MGLGPVGRRFLDAEEGLQLVPGREDRERDQEHEHEQGHPEANVRAPRRALALRAGSTACPLAPVGVLDRERVE